MKLQKILSNIALPVLAVIALFAAVLNYVCRIMYIFIDNEIGVAGFSVVMLALFSVNAAYLTVLAALKIFGIDVFNVRGPKDGVGALEAERSNNNPPPRSLRAKIFGYVLILNSLIAVFSIALDIIYFTEAPENAVGYSFYLGEFLPYLIGFVLLLFVLFILPRFSKKARQITAVLLCAAIVVPYAVSLFNLYPLKLTTGALVLDSGEGYNVVFAANDMSYGFIEYTYEGEYHIVYDNSFGKITASKIHSVKVPYEHLKNNSYKIGIKRMTDELSYGGKPGASVVSKNYNFKGGDKENLNIYVFSDWHYLTQSAQKASSYFEAPADLVILNGDYVDALYSDTDLIKYMISPAADITQGEIPALYVRGNHETRGPYAGKMTEVLGLDSLYYEAGLGEYRFIVLDTAEDKPDSHAEYGGLAAFEHYREKEELWLKSLQPDATKYAIAIAHDSSFAGLEYWAEELDRIGAGVLISGHTHQARIIEDKYAFPIIIVGGRNGKKVTATHLYFSSGTVSVKSFDADGNIVVNAVISLGE